VRALITARNLVRPAHLRKHPDVNVLNVRSGDAYWNNIFRFASGGAGVTADTAGMVNDLCPLNR
jgi:hypothetical protein